MFRPSGLKGGTNDDYDAIFGVIRTNYTGIFVTLPQQFYGMTVIVI